MARSSPSRGTGDLHSFLLVTGSTLLGGLLNAVLIALAARRDEYSEIAAFTVMTAVLAVVAVAAGGGSGLLYISGTEAERSAVRSQRALAVQPALWLAAGLVTLFYGVRGYSWPALVAAALVFCGNNIAELSLAQLNRDRRFVRCALPTCLSKTGAILAFVGGAPLTVALLVGTVLNLILLETLAGSSSALRTVWRDRPSLATARRGYASSGPLTTFTLLELWALRAPSIGLSLVVPVNVMGNFGAVASAYQALLSVFQSGLLMLLSLRSRRRHGLEEEHAPSARGTEILSLVTGLLSTVTLVVVAPVLTGVVLQLDSAEAATWLRILALAVPFYLLNRLVATNAIGDARYTDAARIGVGLAALATFALAVGVPTLGATGAVLATLTAEALVGFVLLGRRVPALLAQRAA